ncbi:MAG TPA: 30S ribosomal protein S20 [Acidobacteria bacterium]|nr:30S ribosomal protein S20 [Acidobacteriota bacterium]
MANHKSAAKQARRNEARRLRNRWWRSRLRSALKTYRAAVDAGEKEKAGSLLAPTLGLVDKTAKAGVIHDNTAARTKSRLQAAYNKLG